MQLHTCIDADTHTHTDYICAYKYVHTHTISIRCDFKSPRNTSDFMIPQSRNRCWMVGLRRDRFSAEDVEEVFQMVQQMKAPKTMALKKYFAHFKVGILFSLLKPGP